MTTEVDTTDRELDGIWFLTTFLYFGYRNDEESNPLKVENISFVPTNDEGNGFSQVQVTLESGEQWRVEVERVA